VPEVFRLPSQRDPRAAQLSFAQSGQTTGQALEDKAASRGVGRAGAMGLGRTKRSRRSRLNGSLSAPHRADGEADTTHGVVYARTLPEQSSGRLPAGMGVYQGLSF